MVFQLNYLKNSTKNRLFAIFIVICIYLLFYLSINAFNTRNNSFSTPLASIKPTETIEATILKTCSSDDPKELIHVSQVMYPPDASGIVFATCDGIYDIKQARTVYLNTKLLKYTPEGYWELIEYPTGTTFAREDVSLLTYHKRYSGSVLCISVQSTRNYLSGSSLHYYKSYDYGESWNYTTTKC